MSYKLVKNPDGTEAPMVQKLPETSFIPFDSDNKDYQEYLEWKAAGNTPDPAD